MQRQHRITVGTPATMCPSPPSPSLNLLSPLVAWKYHHQNGTAKTDLCLRLEPDDKISDEKRVDLYAKENSQNSETRRKLRVSGLQDTGTESKYTCAGSLPTLQWDFPFLHIPFWGQTLCSSTVP